MEPVVTLAACSLNQFALDWEGNLGRIKQSILKAKQAGATLRVGPDLEITGYSCLDHFLEMDLYDQALDMLDQILIDESLFDILLDIGIPIMHKNCAYNARAIIVNGKILCFRPKIYGDNSRENRWFTPWARPGHVEQYSLPPRLAKIHGKSHVPIGDVLINTLETCLASDNGDEICPSSSAEIFTHSNGSHRSLTKLDQRIQLIQEATRKNGGVHLYSTQRGCDGDSLYHDECSLILVNGDIVAQGRQFGLEDVEVITATVDLQEVRAYRFALPKGSSGTQEPSSKPINAEFSLSNHKPKHKPAIFMSPTPTPPKPAEYHLPEEEIAYGPACWLWDYLRRSKASGFLLPLSGGLDSCATAIVVYSMCRLVMIAVKGGDEQVIADVKRIVAPTEDNMPSTPEELCNRIFHTVYLGMASQSSKETRQRAKDLAARIGSYHTDLNIDDVFHATKGLLKQGTGFEPKFTAHGGTHTENIALQNIQARARMCAAYYYAQMLPTVRERPGGGGCLVLGSSNADESVSGYLTKYDCSSADINPIGSFSKVDLTRFIAWAAKSFDMPVLVEFLEATPTAELEPITENYVQSDEADMGMTYVELARFRTLRKQYRLGPYGMYLRLQDEWGEKLSPREIADKVKRFHHRYQINRHKQEVATPAYQAESANPDNLRFDLRPFLYPAAFESWSFKKIDERVETVEKAQEKKRRWDLL